MDLIKITELLKSDPNYEGLVSEIIKGKPETRVQIIDEAVPFFTASLWKDLQIPILLICPSPEHSRRLHEYLSAWMDGESKPLRFGESEILPYERLTEDLSTSRERLITLDSLVKGNSEPLVIVTSASALAQKTISIKSFKKNSFSYVQGDKVNLEDMANSWQQMGYSFESNVSDPGTVSRRGGIIDVYPIGEDTPYRIELWGDEIDSIRTFDPDSQRSINIVDRFSIGPAKETLISSTSADEFDRLLSHVDLSRCSPDEITRFNSEIDDLLNGRQIEELGLYSGFFNNGTLLDYFPEDGLVISYRNIDAMNSVWNVEERANQLRMVKENRGEIPLNFPTDRISWNEIEASIEKLKKNIFLMPWGASDLDNNNTRPMPFSSPPLYKGDLNALSVDTSEFTSGGGSVIAITSHHSRLKEILKGLNPSEPPGTGSVTDLDPLSVLPIDTANIGDGFVINTPQHRLTLLGDKEIFGIAKRRRAKRINKASRETFFEEISPGDYVVHVEHGIARFVGTDSKHKDSGNHEYLILQYAQGDKLYVPMQHLDRVAPYVAPMDRSPSLTRLGTQEWSRTKARVEKSTREMAMELLSIYAARQVSKGHATGPDTKWQFELEESFPYEETVDQISTLVEIKDDMESDRPMDRLICGDVGYGKTELALRAAFKTVMDGKQVAVLVPTTVLAQQHYETFSERMNAFPVKLSVLSRFKSNIAQKETLKALMDGTVDICIGTHRLVQKDVRFKDLGLVIIDEEQRFGVVHKERLKQMRSQVDILTLSATPIPRTLHMSLAGVRDMSTIESAPEERLPIKTYVSEFSDELIREAILREMDRQGQVYFLHNRVYNIEYMSEYIRTLVPDAKIGIAHGQMSEKALEKSMIAFSQGETDVLLCTTIIESGLDIANANTLIVNRADSFGLAQLYQLRGRIGRSSKRGYSYLLIPKSQTMTESAERRLKAMLSATELGSGFKIAMKDLEIRGAGNILGSEQSGHIHAVGFELYTRLLATAVEDLRSQDIPPDDPNHPSSPQPNTVSIDLGIPTGISEDYIEDLPSRLDIYQKLIQCRTLDETDLLERELKDRFGPLPWQALNLLFTVRLKIKASLTGMEYIRKTGEKLVIQFPFEVGGMRFALQNLIGPGWTIGNMQIRSTLIELGDNWEESLVEVVEKLGEFQSRMSDELIKSTAST